MKESQKLYSHLLQMKLAIFTKIAYYKKTIRFFICKNHKMFFYKIFQIFLYRGTVISSPWPATIILKFNSLDNMITSPLPITPGLTKTASYFLIFKFLKIQ